MRAFFALFDNMSIESQKEIIKKQMDCMEMRHVVAVSFWNIDSEYEWKKIYILRKKPTKKWRKSLYDGVNDPQYYRTVGRIF